MADILVYARFNDTPRITELCPTCLLPALKYYILERISPDGITVVGTRIACTDCREWRTKVKEVDQP